MELKDWLNSITFNKDDLIESDPDTIKDYPPYIVNRCLSGNFDTILYANEMNRYPNLDKRLQYDFYINTVRARKRFSPWGKKEKVKDLELVKQYYAYSNEKAKQALRILSPTQLDYIRNKLNKGGKK